MYVIRSLQAYKMDVSISNRGKYVSCTYVCNYTSKGIHACSKQGGDKFYGWGRGYSARSELKKIKHVFISLNHCDA